VDATALAALATRITRDAALHDGQLPEHDRVEAFGDAVLARLFPHGSAPDRTAEATEAALAALGPALREVLHPLADALPELPEALAARFIDELPEIHQRLVLDAAAIEAGDPAARSVSEVVLAYPGFAALAFHRLAHALHGLGIPLVPRLLAEVAHSRTGIDIHPGARIGHACCIDHGTGLVIGETAVIGDAVKLYQGVTLGALSVAKSASGTKRHPTIEDRVVIYANATVLGGDTVVGHDSVIGGNVWLTNSVPPYSLVYHTSSVRVRSVAEASEPTDFVI
jgi:serine O-acetyltransferase